MAAAPALDLQWLEPLLDRLPAPLVLQDPQTAEVLFANRAAHEVAGGRFPLGDESGRSTLHRCFDAGGRLLEYDELPGVRACHGTFVQRERIDWETDAGRRSLLVSTDRMETPDGRPLVVVSFEDVTDIDQDRRRAQVLVEAGAALAGSLDFEETLRTVARLVVPAFADWCFIELLQPDGTIDRSVIEASDRRLLEMAHEYVRRYPLDPDAPVGSPAVIRTGEPELTPRIPPELLETMASDEEHLAILRELRFHSYMIVPLRAHGRVFGDIALVTAESERVYGPDDLVSAQALADRCALYIDSARLYAEQQAARKELQAILEGVADAVTAQDAQGRIVFANPAAARLAGYESPAAMMAAPVEKMHQAFDILDEQRRPFPAERFPGRRALMGETPPPEVVRYRPAGGGPARWARLKAQPVRDESGDVRLAINVIEDITEIKQAELSQRFLAEAGRVLTGSLDYESTLAAVARLAVPEIADWCVVDLRTEDGFERVAVQHSDPDRLALADELTRRYPPDPTAPTGVAQVLRTGRSEFYPEVTDEMLAAGARGEEHLELLRSVGFVGAMIVPIGLRDEVVGVISLINAESGRSFAEDDVMLAEELGRRAGAAIENARLYRQRSLIAQTLQSSLLPPVLPEIERIETAAEYRPAGDGYDVGGDFYDVFSTGDDQWFAVIGDVCGKGVQAAATTALARYTIRAAAVRRRSPAQILAWLNDAMLRQRSGSQTFCTIAVVRLDTGGEHVRATVASGGHPLPRVVRAGGTVDRVGEPGTLMGVVPDVVLTDRATELAPGDTLVLFTDGLTEAGAPSHVWSDDDLDAALGETGGGPRELVEGVLAAALGEGGDSRDDVAVLALRARPGS